MKHLMSWTTVIMMLSAQCFAQGNAQGSASASTQAAGAVETPTVAAKPANIQNLGFKYGAAQSIVEIALDRDATFEKTVNDANKQVVIEIKGAKISKKWSRRLDTSQYKGNIAMVSPYQTPDGNVRVVLQMRDGTNVDVAQDGLKIVATIQNGTASSAAAAVAAPVENADSVSNNAADATAATATPEKTDAPVSAKSENPLDTFMDAQKTKTYVGKPITLQLREADLSDVFRVVSEASEFNIVLAEEVKGKVTLNLNDVPWDQALDLILHSYKLAAERQGNVLRVTTLDSLTKEKQAEVAAQKASEAAEPIVVKIFPVSYGKPADIAKILEDFLSKDVNAGNTKRGSIQIDERTNSLIVRDTATSIEKIKRILRELDTQTPQVLIEAKFVVVGEQNDSELQGRIFSSSRELMAGGIGVNSGVNNYSATFNGAGYGDLANPGGFSVTSPPGAGGAAFGFMPKVGLFPGFSEIGAFLKILEGESKSKTIASPRVITQNKEKAEITQGQTIQIFAPGGANGQGSFQQINAVLKLSVTPQVTNDGAISMRINFSQDSIGATPPGASFATDSRKVDTQVQVDSGGTLVIGGVYNVDEQYASAGIPLLRDIPILGVLFGSKKKTLKKSELFIFLTPRVLNEKETRA